MSAGADGRGSGLERLFIGVPLPGELLGHVQAEQRRLADLGVPGLRLMTAEQLHVTLAFIGEVPASGREAASKVVRTLPDDSGGPAELGGVLPLPSARKARVVALEIDDARGVFARLYEVVASGLEAARVMRREGRPYRPHLTIARIKPPAAVQPRSECTRRAYPVESVHLYRSELSRAGARYTVVASKTVTTSGITRN